MQFDLLHLLPFIGILSFAATSPTPQSKPPPPPCIVPQIFFTSLPKPFTLAAQIPRSSSQSRPASWPVQLFPRSPSKDVISKPVISQTKIVPPSFKLVNQTLVTAVGGIPADLNPFIQIFPPPLQSFTFGGPGAGDSAGKFGAIYSCDATGKQIIILVPDQAAGFAVEKVAEGQQVLLKPQQFAGSAVDVSLRIDGGR